MRTIVCETGTTVVQKSPGRVVDIIACNASGAVDVVVYDGPAANGKTLVKLITAAAAVVNHSFRATPRAETGIVVVATGAGNYVTLTIADDNDPV